MARVVSFFFKIEKHGELGLKYLKLLSEISRLNFININAYKFGQPAILASKHCSLLTVSRGVSVKGGPDTCGSRMRTEKYGKNKTRNAETNKQTKERNLSFKFLSHDWDLHVQNSLSIDVTGYSGFFLSSLNPVIPFIYVTETSTLCSSSFKPRMLWCTSPLSRQPGYSVLNLQKRKYSLGNQIENCLFERFETKKRSVKKQKGRT